MFKCVTCLKVIYVGDDEAELKEKLASHHDWHHSTQEMNLERTRELFTDVVTLMEQIRDRDYVGAFATTDSVVSLAMKINRFVEDNMGTESDNGSRE